MFMMKSDQLPSLQPCTVFQKFTRTIFHWGQFSVRLAVWPINAPHGCQNLQVSYAGTHPTAKDAFHFIKMIADHELDRNHMCSCDVKGLFSNIPVDFTVNLIPNKVFGDKEGEFHGLNRTELRKMLNWTRKILFCNWTENITHRHMG